MDSLQFYNKGFRITTANLNIWTKKGNEFPFSPDINAGFGRSKIYIDPFRYHCAPHLFGNKERILYGVAIESGEAMPL